MLFVFLCVIFVRGVLADEHDIYRFGVFPYLSAVLLEEIYAPASHDLSNRLNKKVHFRTASTFKKFFQNLERGVYDFALIQPFWYPPAVDRFHYLPMVRMKEPFVSLVMVQDKSGLQNVMDLKGRIVATPPAFVPVVHMARKTLARHGLISGQSYKMKHFKSVDSCFQQLIIGAADACVSPPFAPAVIEEKMQIKLRVLAQSESIPNLSLVVHERVPKHDQELIKAAFLEWSTDAKGQKLLMKMQTKEFVTAVDSEYDVVRAFLKEIEQH